MARALADDVEALSLYAQNIARCCVESSVDPEELPVCCSAPGWAKQLADLAVEIRVTISAALGVS
jgi:hypothetical protein